jgi:dihydrofolate reductase
MIHKPCLSIIVANTPAGIIGYQSQLPWHLPADLRYFKQITMGKTIIMGRKTHESIGRALPGRNNVVISRTHKNFANCKTCTSLDEALHAHQKDDEIMIIGGGELYRAAMPLADRIYQTLVEYQGPGDTYFPTIDTKQWQLISQEDHLPDAHNAYAHCFMVWQHK